MNMVSESNGNFSLMLLLLWVHRKRNWMRLTTENYQEIKNKHKTIMKSIYIMVSRFISGLIDWLVLVFQVH